jgi:Zn-dependent M16 (insulinase) family peptidase
MAELIGQRLVNLCSATNGASDAAVDLRHYRLQQSKMDVVFMPVPGALVSATVVVPTRSFNHSGLAHTLEHLVFCGSERYPNRGFLDMLATRSYSTGTNAYTCEDHTGYTIVTAGAEGKLIFDSDKGLF